MRLYEGKKTDTDNFKSINDMLVECAKVWEPQLHKSTEDIDSRVLDSSEGLLPLPSLPTAGNTHLLTYSSIVCFLNKVLDPLTYFLLHINTSNGVLNYYNCTNLLV